MSDHDQSRLGPYVLGALGPDEAQAVEQHLAECADCRQLVVELEETKDMLSGVPPEAFLDGPPDDGDLMLQRTLRAARAGDAAPAAEQPTKRRRWMPAAAAAAVIAAVALGGGVLIGQRTADPGVSEAPVAGSMKVTATDDTTGATMATTLEPREGWSWVRVKVTGLKAGAECELVVTAKDGKTYVAGSWLVSEKAAREGSQFGGGVLLPIGEVALVEVRTAEGEHVVTTPI
jgi:anti-sigma-K factor RskA